jgi:CCR4-NOT transcription complex subunit 9
MFGGGGAGALGVGAGAGLGVGIGAGISPQGHIGMGVHEEGKIYSLVIELLDMNTREMALLELSKRREQYDDLALVLWHSFGTFPPNLSLSFCIDIPKWPVAGVMAALLQEIVAVYPLLSPPNLTAHVSNRVCNALALLQCVASHAETRQLFLSGMSL